MENSPTQLVMPKSANTIISKLKRPNVVVFSNSHCTSKKVEKRKGEWKKRNENIQTCIRESRLGKLWGFSSAALKKASYNSAVWLTS